MFVDWTQYEQHAFLVKGNASFTTHSVSHPADIVDGGLIQAALALLCLTSVLFSLKAIVSYKRYIDADSIAIESPAMFLLPWLAIGDIAISITLGVAFVWPGCSGSSIAVAHLPKIHRAIHASQVFHCLITTMLSVHIMSVAGLIERKVDMHCGGYYGMATLMLSFALSHPVFAGQTTTLFLCFTVIPLAALASVAVAAATCMFRKTSNSPQRCVLRLDDSEDIEATVDIGKYRSFSAKMAMLFWLHNLPWFIWTHVHTAHAYWNSVLYVTVVLGVCSRGELSLALLKSSPATSMRPASTNSRAKYHDHQE